MGEISFNLLQYRVNALEKILTEKGILETGQIDKIIENTMSEESAANKAKVKKIISSLRLGETQRIRSFSNDIIDVLIINKVAESEEPSITVKILDSKAFMLRLKKGKYYILGQIRIVENARYKPVERLSLQDLEFHSEQQI